MVKSGDINSLFIKFMIKIMKILMIFLKMIIKNLSYFKDLLFYQTKIWKNKSTITIFNRYIHYI